MLEVQPGTASFEQVLILAARVLAQDRYLASRVPHALESHVLAAFDGTRCIVQEADQVRQVRMQY